MTDLESLHFYYPFAATLAGFIIPLVTGLLSACSSGLIIYIIRRSQQKFSTTYHRIMTCMSVFDIISSLFIALGTIMVPSDNVYKFAGPLLGTKTTCQIQGGLIMFGLAGGICSNASLCFYFVCRLTFQISAHCMEKYIEPVMYIYTMILAIALPSLYLAADLIHPHAYDCFCTLAPYPESCNEDLWYDWSYCEWNDGVIDKYFEYTGVSFIAIVIHFAIIVVGMSVILWTARTKQREIQAGMSAQEEEEEDVYIPSHDEIVIEQQQQQQQEEQEGDVDNRKNQTMNDLQHSRVLTLQALMYIGAFFLTWIFNVLSGGLNVASTEMDAVSSMSFTLQGFWNLLIFLYDKTYLIRQNDPSLSFWQGAKKILTFPNEVPVISITNIVTVNASVEETMRHHNEQEEEQEEEEEIASIGNIDSQYGDTSNDSEYRDASNIRESSSNMHLSFASSVMELSDIVNHSSIRDNKKYEFLDKRTDIKWMKQT